MTKISSIETVVQCLNHQLVGPVDPECRYDIWHSEAFWFDGEEETMESLIIAGSIGVENDIHGEGEISGMLRLYRCRSSERGDRQYLTVWMTPSILMTFLTGMLFVATNFDLGKSFDGMKSV